MMRSAHSVRIFCWLLAIGFSTPAWAQFGLSPNPVPEAKACQQPGSAFNPLIELIESSIAATSWDKVGGAGSIEAVDQWGVVVISQTREVHEEIEHLVGVIRKARRLQDPDAAAKQEAAGGEADAPISLPAGSEADNQARQRIEAALASKITLQFTQTPLHEVVAFIREQTDIPILLDQRSIDDAGIPEDTPINVNLQNISLKAALRLMLDRLDLTYIIHDEVLQITTPECAERRLVTRVYLVRDLAVERAPATGKAKERVIDGVINAAEAAESSPSLRDKTE